MYIYMCWIPRVRAGSRHLGELRANAAALGCDVGFFILNFESWISKNASGIRSRGQTTSSAAPLQFVLADQGIGMLFRAICPAAHCQISCSALMTLAAFLEVSTNLCHSWHLCHLNRLWILSFKFRILNFGFWILSFEEVTNSKFKIKNLQFEIPNSKLKIRLFKILNFESWTLNFEFWFLNWESRIFHFNFWILYFDFRGNKKIRRVWKDDEFKSLVWFITLTPLKSMLNF